MLLKQKNPRVILRAGLWALLVSSALPLVARTMPAQWTDALDAIRGAFLGAAITLLLIAIRQQRRISG